MEIKYKIWLEKDGRVIFGRGREELFKAIDEHRSLNAAAKKLNMSYRAAWGRIKASEKRLGIRLVETDQANKGMTLTPDAKALMSKYRQMEKDAERSFRQAENEFRALIEGGPDSKAKRDKT